MSNYCKQCSVDHFGKDYKELAGLADREAEGLYPIVLCEGCGHIQVNNKGECVSSDCERPGHHIVVEVEAEAKEVEE